MKISILERVLTPQLLRPRMAKLGEFAPPLISRVGSSLLEIPWVSSNSKGLPVQTSLKDKKYIAQVFFNCSIEEEEQYLQRFYDNLWQLFEKNGWGNRVKDLPSALEGMSRSLMRPEYLVMPYKDLKLEGEMTSEEVDIVTLSKGYFVEIDGIKVISAREGLRQGCWMVFANRAYTGHYLRSLDFLAWTLKCADRSVFLIRSDVD